MNQLVVAFPSTKQVRDLKEVFDFCRTPRPDLPDSHPANRTLDGYNRWPQGQVRAASVSCSSCSSCALGSQVACHAGLPRAYQARLPVPRPLALQSTPRSPPLRCL